MLRRPVIAGNWKMNTTKDTGSDLASELMSLSIPAHVDVIICPPYTHLSHIYEITRQSDIKVGAQNMHYDDFGAFTGDISAPMLTNIGIHNVILGHSERREYYLESNKIINAKIKKALDARIQPIFCIGETLEEREANQTFDVLKTQLLEGWKDLETNIDREKASFIIAYEPVWAIGTGKVASPEQAQEVHAFIRQTVKTHISVTAAEHIRILYGGSVKADNAHSLLHQQDIDGALVGGASLKAHDFAAIINAAPKGD